MLGALRPGRRRGEGHEGREDFRADLGGRSGLSREDLAGAEPALAPSPPPPECPEPRLPHAREPGPSSHPQRQRSLTRSPIHAPAIEDEYSGPKLEDGKVTITFMKELMQWYKDQKKLHRKCAYQVKCLSGAAHARDPWTAAQCPRCPAQPQRRSGRQVVMVVSWRCAGHCEPFTSETVFFYS